jgi:5-methylcytosine-specific restriction endonuclease McrA
MHCLNCNNELIPTKGRKNLRGKKYCNNSCQHEYQSKNKMQSFLDGKNSGQLFQIRGWSRRLLIDKKGYKCESCKIESWLEKDITLEVHHIDGNASNNILENLEFLCPNCHSQTDTFRAKNKNSARKR